MSASLVGSEMCIRDRCGPGSARNFILTRPRPGSSPSLSALDLMVTVKQACLLYTSDAADDM
eukprot:4465059-Alexandrium_andersonii.AAC.1